jgi:hypothetical protein
MRLGVTPTTPLLINGLLKMTQKTENYGFLALLLKFILFFVNQLIMSPFREFEVGVFVPSSLTEDGFLNGCELVFKGISTDGRDYHTEMNSIIFEKWVNE